MPYLISTSPAAGANREPADDIERVPYIRERERRILKQARQSAARKPYLALDELDRSQPSFNAVWSDGLVTAWTSGFWAHACSGMGVL
jgi:hypothetical protein